MNLNLNLNSQLVEAHLNSLSIKDAMTLHVETEVLQLVMSFVISGCEASGLYTVKWLVEKYQMSTHNTG